MNDSMPHPTLRLKLSAFLAVALLALPAAAASPAANADQLVDLFAATCLHFGADRDGMRAWLDKQSVPRMQEVDANAFLAARNGRAYDASFQDITLALVSLDNGTCEAVAKTADPQEVTAGLQNAGKNLSIAPLGTTADPLLPAVQVAAYTVTIAGKTHRLTSISRKPQPQAVLDLFPPQP